MIRLLLATTTAVLLGIACAATGAWVLTGSGAGSAATEGVRPADDEHGKSILGPGAERGEAPGPDAPPIT